MNLPTITKTSHVGRTLKCTSYGLVEETIRGTEAVKQWLEVMLKQRPGLTPVYDFDNAALGVDSVSVSSQPRAVALAEIERNIRETAELCSGIRSVGNFKFTRGKNTLSVSFTVFLYGEDDNVDSEVMEFEL